MYKLVDQNDPILHEIADDISVMDNIDQLIKEMFLILYDNKGVGLAAPQIGISRRIIVINTSQYDNGIVCALINPKIIATNNFKIKTEEGCISCPGIFKIIERPSEIIIRTGIEKSSCLYLSFKDISAVVVQHEIDHLDGILITDK